MKYSHIDPSEMSAFGVIEESENGRFRVIAAIDTRSRTTNVEMIKLTMKIGNDKKQT